jgi:hypothetical protein
VTFGSQSSSIACSCASVHQNAHIETRRVGISPCKQSFRSAEYFNHLFGYKSIETLHDRYFFFLTVILV